MSLRLVKASANVEQDDNFHLSRLLILLQSNLGKKNKPIDGIMKLAKLDFLLRYPNCLERVLRDLDRQSLLRQYHSDEESRNIESRMIRFRYGPWDDRYRRWIGLLVARGLAETYLQGRTVKVGLTTTGKDLAVQFREISEFEAIAQRSDIVAKAVGAFPATKLKDYIYKVFPEIIDMRWGDEIEI